MNLQAESTTEEEYYGWAEHLDDQQKTAYKMDDDE